MDKRGIIVKNLFVTVVVLIGVLLILDFIGGIGGEELTGDVVKIGDDTYRFTSTDKILNLDNNKIYMPRATDSLVTVYYNDKGPYNLGLNKEQIVGNYKFTYLKCNLARKRWGRTYCYDVSLRIVDKGVAPSSGSKCTDSDGGKDYYVKGTLTFTKGTLTSAIPIEYPDKCGSSSKLNERFCGVSKEERSDDWVESTTYDCPNGCKDGACVKEEEEVPEPVPTPTPVPIVGGLTTAQKQDVLNMLNKCHTMYTKDNSGLKSCDDFCKLVDKTCTGAFINIQYATGDVDGTVLNQWESILCASGGASNPINCICCSP